MERGVSEKPTSVHGTQHADNESVDSVTLLDLRHEGRNSTLVVRRTAEMGKDELLERVNVVLEIHQVHDRFEAATTDSRAEVSWEGELREKAGRGKPFVRIVDAAKRDVLFVFEEAVEVLVHLVKLEFREDQLDVRSNQSTVACFRSNTSVVDLFSSARGCANRPRETSPPTVLAHVSSQDVWFCASFRTWSSLEAESRFATCCR